MKEILTTSGAITAIISILLFIKGIFMLTFAKDKKAAVKVIITAVILFIIGFGTCSTFMGPLNMH